MFLYLILVVFAGACTDIKKPDTRIKKDEVAQDVAIANSAISFMKISSFDSQTIKFDLQLYNYDSSKGLSIDDKGTSKPDESNKGAISFSGTSLDEITVRLNLGEQETSAVIKFNPSVTRRVLSAAQGNTVLRIYFLKTNERVKIYLVTFPMNKKTFAFGIGYSLTAVIYNQKLSMASIASSKSFIDDFSEGRDFSDEKDFGKPTELIKL